MKLLPLFHILILNLTTNSVSGGVYQDRGYPPEYAPEVGGASEDVMPEDVRPEDGMIGTIDESTSSEDVEVTTKRARSTTSKASSESSSSSEDEDRKEEKEQSHKKEEKESSHHHLGSELEKFGDSASTSAEFHKLRKRIKPLFAGSIDSRGNLFTGDEKEKTFNKKFEDEDATSEYERVHGKEHGDSDELEDEGHGGHKVHWGSSRSKSSESEEEHRKHKKEREEKRHHRRSSEGDEEGPTGTITSLGEFGDVEKVDEKKVTSDAVSLIKEVLNP